MIPEPNSGCWLWLGATSQGYGHVRQGGRLWTAHRYAYVYAGHDEVPGLVIDHLCRTTLCVNPAHLEQVTYAENLRRGDKPEGQSRKTHCPRGHEYSDENTYRTPRNERVCRECYRAHWRAWNARKKAAC